MLKFCLYLMIIPLVVFACDSININSIFKKNKVNQARVFYVLMIFGLSYLTTNFLYDFIYVVNK